MSYAHASCHTAAVTDPMMLPTISFAEMAGLQELYCMLTVWPGPICTGLVALCALLQLWLLLTSSWPCWPVACSAWQLLSGAAHAWRMQGCHTTAWLQDGLCWLDPGGVDSSCSWQAWHGPGRVSSRPGGCPPPGTSPGAAGRRGTHGPPSPLHAPAPPPCTCATHQMLTHCSSNSVQPL